LSVEDGTREEGHFVFRFCPGCGRRGIASEGGRRWICGACGFEYFHNVAAAAGVIVEGPEGILLIERAKEPAKGLLCLPGGFVEPGERAEEAARRECREELGWEPGELVFLFSFPNTYNYNEVPYSTCDIYFAAKVPSLEPGLFRPDPRECAALVIRAPEALAPETLAFDSMRRAVEGFLRMKGRPCAIV
jgi:ADP-ribose pyrophosphatase YjhB (NUDIX family)